MTVSRRGRVVFTVALLLLGVAAGFLLAQYMPAAGEPPPRVLLDLRQPVDSMGAVFAFTVDEPCMLRVSVQLEGRCADVEAEGAFGPLLPAMRPHPVYEPDAALDTRFTVTPTSSGPWLLEAKKPGVYAVRLDPIPSAMGADDEPVAAVRVEWVGGL